MVKASSPATSTAVVLDERRPTDSSDSVVFWADGEPATPQSMLAQLQAAESEAGIEPDSYSLGGAVEKLEQRMAEMLGKAAGVFMPTGTLANHLAIRRLCGSSPRAVAQEQSHMYQDTGDCVQQLSGIHLLALAPGRAFFTPEELTAAVEGSNAGRVANPVGAVMIESPVRRHGGQVMPLEEMVAITTFCESRGIGTHLDGARLYMMSAATGVSPRDYAELFDTVYVSLYKYFGAPYGAILAGSRDLCEGLFHDRRMFGGGLASSAFAAALALRGIDGFVQRFARAMDKASELFDGLNTLDGIRVDRYENGSNLFPLILNSGIDVAELARCLRDSRVFLNEGDRSGAIHLTVNTTILRQSNDEIVDAFRKALKCCKD